MQKEIAEFEHEFSRAHLSKKQGLGLRNYAATKVKGLETMPTQ